MALSPKKQGVWFVALLAILVCTPSTNAGGLFGGRNTGLADILAAGLVTKLLMESMGALGGGGGGGGQGRISLFDHIGHGLSMAAARHRQQFSAPPPPPPSKAAESFLKYAFLPSPLLRDPRGFHAEEMRIHPQFLLPPRLSPLMFSEANAIPLMSLPYEGLLGDHLGASSSLDFLGLPDNLEDAQSGAAPMFVDEAELAGLRPTPQEVYEMRADEERSQYILPRIVRHFVQRILHRGEQ